MIIPVKVATGEYNVVIERGALAKLREHLNLDRKVLIVTDSGVPIDYAKTVASQCGQAHIVTIPEGETSKSFKNFERLLSSMVRLNFTRSDCVVAVGGGVVGDLAGFVAASFMRGVDFYNVPTTVLSQVDSSVGGKVAIDFEGFKNLVGAFYPPRAVIIDSDTLKTLPERQISNGLAESVKMALTFDSELFSFFENEEITHQNIDMVIEASVRIKRAVVEEDEKEGGMRRVLNFGHTLAHAIESENEMRELYHGECVALGMLPMCSCEVRERLRKVLQKLNLPTILSFDIEKAMEAISHDKKASDENLKAVFVETVGKYVIKDMPLSEFKEILEREAK